MADAELTVGFIGAGKMATALARGIIDSGFVTAERVHAVDIVPAAAEDFATATGATVHSSNQEVAAAASVIIIAVKPHHVGAVLDDLASLLSENHLIVSIAAGVPLSVFQMELGAERRIVRVMPNAPCLVGAAAAGFSLGSAATEQDAELVESMLATVGLAMKVEERLLDAVTGLSGSGPAYVYQVIEALSDGGVRVGLPRNTATELAAQTVLGAALMVLKTGEHPGVLKDAVTSAGGTTIAGLHALEQGGLRGTLMNAVEAATQRSRELGPAA
ncbi:MAG: pyrroline-5-carboxylate reductase [Planctomycetaceae bacterium]